MKDRLSVYILKKTTISTVLFVLPRINQSIRLECHNKFCSETFLKDWVQILNTDALLDFIIFLGFVSIENEKWNLINVRGSVNTSVTFRMNYRFDDYKRFISQGSLLWNTYSSFHVTSIIGPLQIITFVEVLKILAFLWAIILSLQPNLFATLHCLGRRAFSSWLIAIIFSLNRCWIGA